MNKPSKGKKKIPFFAIGNNELADKKTAGKFAKCPKCKKKKIIEFPMSKTLLPNGKWSKHKKTKVTGLVSCCKGTYLVSMGGKLL